MHLQNDVYGVQSRVPKYQVASELKDLDVGDIGGRRFPYSVPGSLLPEED